MSKKILRFDKDDMPDEVLHYEDHEVNSSTDEGCQSRSHHWSFCCTRPKGHRGLHEAMGMYGEVCGRWDR